MTPAIVECARVFGQDRTLVGIVTRPARTSVLPAAFILLNAGVVHRVGPNRFHVDMARTLGALGFMTVRVDLSGLGDSESRRDSTPFDQASVLETREIMSAIEQEFGVAQFVTAGLCSGAVVAFKTAVEDDRVRGAVLINPQGFVSSAEWNAHVVSKARARRYWSEKLLSPASWRRALTGRSHYRSLIEVIKRRALSRVAPDDTVAEVAGSLAADFGNLQSRGARLLLACSEGDLGMDYLQSILGPRFTRRERIDTLMLPKGDHSLTMAISQRRFLEGLGRWAAAFVPQPAAAAAAAGMPATVVVARAPLP